MHVPGDHGHTDAAAHRGIGMRVVAWTMHPDKALGFELLEFDHVLRSSDVVSLHLRLSPQTMGLIGPREFALMKPTALLINTARGAIVDEAALVEALSTNLIAGAGLDVFTTEPLQQGNPLTNLHNVVLTPHSAGITPEALEAGLQMAIENVRNFLTGWSPEPRA